MKKILSITLIIFALFITTNRNLSAQEFTGINNKDGSVTLNNGVILKTNGIASYIATDGKSYISGVYSFYDNMEVQNKNSKSYQLFMLMNNKYYDNEESYNKAYKIASDSVNNSINRGHKNSKGGGYGKDSRNYFKGGHYIKDTGYGFNKSGYVNTHYGGEKCKYGGVYARGIYGYYSDLYRKINGVGYHFDTNAYAHKS